MLSGANENELGGRRRTRSEPDAHGQAALVLAESILHALVEKKTLSVREAIDVVQTAEEVKADMAALVGESPGKLAESLRLLERIAGSLELDA